MLFLLSLFIDFDYGIYEYYILVLFVFNQEIMFIAGQVLNLHTVCGIILSANVYSSCFYFIL